METRTKLVSKNIIDPVSNEIIAVIIKEETYLIESLRIRLWKNKKFVFSILHLLVLIALLYAYHDKTSIILFTSAFWLTADYSQKTFMEELKK